MLPNQSLRKTMYVPPSKKELVVVKNESLVSMTASQPPSRNSVRGKRATLSSIILSKQLQSAQQIPKTYSNLTQISEDTTSNSNEYSSKHTIDSSITNRKNLFHSNDGYEKDSYFNNNYMNSSRKKNNHMRCASCEYEKGVVDFYRSPIKRHKRSYSIESKEKKYDNPFCEKKIVLIQSTLRKFILRKKLYNMIVNYYKNETLVNHLQNVFNIQENKMAAIAFEKIKKYKKRQYYVTRKQLHLLDELKKRKITTIKQLTAYLDWLEKTKL